MIEADVRESLMNGDNQEGSNEFYQHEDPLAQTYVPQLDFEMNQKTLTSPEIEPMDLKMKIQEYLECDSLTKDQLILILKQGAQDNNLFMVGEDTYSKLADSLGIPLQESEDDENFRLTTSIQKSKADLLQTIRDFKSNNRKSRGDTNEIVNLMKSRRMLNHKSIYEEQNNVERLSRITMTRRDPSVPAINDIESVHSEANFNNLPSKQQDPAFQGDQYLLEQTPKISNQKLKNNLINAGIIILSILFFTAFVLQTIFMFNENLIEMLGTQIIIARG